MFKRVVTVACMLLLVALGPALVASAAPVSGPAPVASWWSGVTQWWAAALGVVLGNSDTAAADTDTEDVAAPPAVLSQPIPPGGETESNPSIDPNG